MQARLSQPWSVVARYLGLVGWLLLSGVLGACGGGNTGVNLDAVSVSDGQPGSDGRRADGRAALSPILSDVRLDRTLTGFHVIGSPSGGQIVVTPVDPRNRVLGYDVVNPTVGGGAVAVAADGMVNWTPNEKDFNTTALQLFVRMREGPVQLVQISVRVQMSSPVFETILTSSQSIYGDTQGRLSLRAATIDDSPLSGRLSVEEFFDREGNVAYRATAENDKVVVTFLDFPPRRSALPGVINTQSVDAAPGMIADVTGALGLSGDAQWLQLNNGQCFYLEFMRFGMPVAEDWRGTIITTRPGGDPVTNKRFKKCELLYEKPSLAFPEGRNVPKVTISSQSATSRQAIRIDATCFDKTSCQRQGAPVILIHGFNPSLEISGGGSGTWNNLAQMLSDSSHSGEASHDVFEFRWVTYMRFEEAAGQLALLIEKVSAITGKKPVVLAHSFGGIVSHLTLSGQGVVWDGSGWVAKTGIESHVKRLITLGSPIGGISNSIETELFGPLQQAMTFRKGRDNEVTIPFCNAITCVQAGAFDLAQERGGLNALLFWVDHPSRQFANDGAELAEYNKTVVENDKSQLTTGESIFRLAQKVHYVPTSIVLGVNSDKNDFALTGFDNIGDGLISMRGQYHPGDIISPSLKEISAGTPAAMFYIKGDATRGYFFLPGGVHTSIQDKTTLLGVREAFYDGKNIEYCENLKFRAYVDCVSTKISESHLWTMNKAPYQGAGQQVGLFREPVTPITNPLPDYRMAFKIYSPCPAPRICTQAADVVAALPLTVELRQKLTGNWARSQSYYTDAAGAVDVDLNMLIDASGAGFNRADYQARITMGDGVTYERTTVVVDDLTPDLIQVPDIVLQRYGVSGTGSLSGRVVDKVGRPIVSAIVSLKAGSNLSAGDFTALPTSTVARKVNTDANGRFEVSGLRATEFGIQIRGATFTQIIRNGLVVAKDGTVSYEFIVNATSCTAPLVLQDGGCISPAPTPVVSNITPGTAIYGVATTFTVAGQYLPTTAVLEIGGTACSTPTSNSTTGFTTVCTVAGSVAADKVLTVRSGKSGTVIDSSRTAKFTAAPVGPTVRSIEPATAIVAVPTPFTVLGNNLPLTAVLSVADGTCTTPTSRATGGFISVCTPGGAPGPKVLTVKTNTQANNGTIIDASRNVMVTVAPIYGTLNVTPLVKSVYQAVTFWISNAYATVKSVVWNFGVGIAEQTKAVTNGISAVANQVFTTIGLKTVTATYKDVGGNVLGKTTVTFTVTQAVVSTTAVITSVKTAGGVAIVSGSSTPETRPVMAGTLGAPLSTYEVLRLYRGAELMGTAIVNASNWTFTPATALPSGTHSLKAVVARADGVEGTPSAAWVITVSGASANNLLLGGIATNTCVPYGSYGCASPGNLTDGDESSAAHTLVYTGVFNISLSSAKDIGMIRLLPNMLPNGNVNFEVQTSTDSNGAAGTWTSHGGRLTQAWTSRAWVNVPLNANTTGVRMVKVSVYSSPSWVSFFEVQGYAAFSVPASSFPGVTYTNAKASSVACNVAAAGSWNNGPTSNYGPGGLIGVPGGVGVRLPSAPSVSLIMMRRSGGVDISGELIGSAATVTIGANETVYFSGNDSILPYGGWPNAYPDNQGSMTVMMDCN